MYDGISSGSRNIMTIKTPRHNVVITFYNGLWGDKKTGEKIHGLRQNYEISAFRPFLPQSIISIKPIGAVFFDSYCTYAS